MSKVSLIIPVYNVEKYLNKCLESVINQTYKDLEIICVYDESSDKSLDILREYEKTDSRIKVVLSDKKEGLGAARNKGLKYATGEYLYFLDSDDWIDSDYIEKMLNAAIQTNADIVVNTNFIKEYKNKTEIFIWELYPRAPKDGEFLNSAKAINITPCMIWAHLYNAEFFKKNNLSFPVVPHHEDNLFQHMSKLLTDKIYAINGAAYHYVQRDDSLMATRESKIYYSMYIESIIFDFYKNNNILKKYNPSTFNPFPLQDISCEKEFVAAQQFLKKLQENGILKRILLYDFEHYIVDAVLSSDNFEIYRKKYGQSLKISYIRRGLKRKPKVSVIVPVYNTEQYLKRCLDSICFQTLKDIEIICINDASTDDSLHILKEYALLDNRIKVVNFEQNQEVSHARNIGIEMARGEYIGFVDSDDTIESYCYEKLYNSAKESDADIAKGALKAVNGKYSGVRQINTKIKENRVYFWQEFTSAIFRRDFLMKNNLKFSEKIDAWEDPLFALQCAKRANVISFVDDVVYNYITRLDSKSYIADLNYAMQRAQALEAMLDETNTEEEYKIVYLEIIMNLYFAFRSNMKTEEDKRQADTFIQMVLDKRPDYHIERDLNKLYKDWYNRKMLAVTNLVRKKRSYQNV